VALEVQSASPCSLLLLETAGRDWLRAKRPEVLVRLQRAAAVTAAEALAHAASRRKLDGQTPPPTNWRARIKALRRPAQPAPDPAEALAEAPGWRMLPPEAGRWVASRARTRALVEGEVLHRLNTPAEAIVVLVSGALSVGGAPIGPGSTVGLAGWPWGHNLATCAATAPSWCLTLDRAIWQEAPPAIAESLAQLVWRGLTAQAPEAAAGLRERSDGETLARGVWSWSGEG
jgi:hypothetical protein